jgi:DNA-binding NtrC family response regulator
MKAQHQHTPQILVLDSDPAVLAYIHSILADRFSVSLFTEAAELIRRLWESPEPNLLLMDWHIAEGDTEDNTLSLLMKIHASKPSLPIIMLVCFAELKEVLDASRIGIVDMVLKPFRKNDIDFAVQQCLQRDGKHPFDVNDDFIEIPLDENKSFVRSSKRMREIETQCRLLARADIPVLILGESGTGKEVATRFIHKMSARSHRTFLKVNCAAMPTELLESELFGYEQGAFTGAVKSKPGKFEVCNNGTIFLDEIGVMPVGLQAKLLEVLQDGCFSRLGGHSIVKVDVRVIAATNIDIKAAIAQRTFREDLYYRLNGFTLKLPPLRERTEEIPILAAYFMRKIAAKYGRDPLPISPALMQALTSYSWPGNLRELENTITRYIILADEQAIMNDMNPRQFDGAFEVAWDDTEGPGLKDLVRNLKNSAESSAIAQALVNTGWNRKVAASNMHISYKALLNKITQYNLSPPPKQHYPNQAHR